MMSPSANSGPDLLAGNSACGQVLLSLVSFFFEIEMNKRKEMLFAIKIIRQSSAGCNDELKNHERN